jgi:hypothetical protein
MIALRSETNKKGDRQAILRISLKAEGVCPFRGVPDTVQLHCSKWYKYYKLCYLI